MKSVFLLLATMILSISAQAQDMEGSEWNRGGWDQERGWGPGGPGGWPGGRDETYTVLCESRDHRKASCGVNGNIAHARVARQVSKSSCNFGESWGFDRNYIWVQYGCRAEFVVTVRSEGRPGGPGRPGPGPRPPQRSDSIRCASKDYGFSNCGVRGFIDYVEIERQHSRSSCVRGESYGYNRQSVWVDRGCEATFRVYYR